MTLHSMKEPVALREAARRFGVSDTLVRQQVYDRKSNPNGCLRASVGEQKKGSKIVPVLDWPTAYKEWTSAGKAIRNPEYYPANDEALNQLPKLEEEIKKNVIDTKPPELSSSTQFAGNSNAVSALGFKSLLTPGMNAYQAENVKAIYEAGLKELAYLKLMGSLVPVDRVRFVLFEYGKTIKEAFLQIPARIAEHVRAAKSDREAMDIMYKDMESVLALLAQGPAKSMSADAADEDVDEADPKDYESDK